MRSNICDNVEFCDKVDQACAALIQDLKQRSLLDETLVIWAANSVVHR